MTVIKKEVNGVSLIEGTGAPEIAGQAKSRFKASLHI